MQAPLITPTRSTALLLAVWAALFAAVLPTTANARQTSPRKQFSSDRAAAGQRVASVCVRRQIRIRVPARWVTVRWHGHRIRVKLPPSSRIVTVTNCHSNSHCVTRREHIHIPARWVTVIKPGRPIRVELPPLTRKVTVHVCHHGSRCTTKQERIRIPARWVTVHTPAKRIRVKLPGQIRTVTVVECP